MKNRDRYVNELVAIMKSIATPEDNSNSITTQNESFEVFYDIEPYGFHIVIWRLGNRKTAKPYGRLSKRKLVNILKRYGFKVDWERYNKLVYGE